MIIGLVTLFVILFAGGGSQHTSVAQVLQEASSLVEKHVQDPTRAAEAGKLLASMRDEISGATQNILDHQAATYALDRDYKVTKEQFEQAFAETNAIWDNLEASLVKGQLQLRRYITAEEWAKIYAELEKKRE